MSRHQQWNVSYIRSAAECISPTISLGLSGVAREGWGALLESGSEGRSEAYGRVVRVYLMGSHTRVGAGRALRH